MDNSNLDPVTSLLSRQFAFAKLDKLCLHAARDKTQFGVLLIDIDNFKPVNDQNGFNVGDFCIKAIAQEIQRVAASCISARFGGNEFAVFVSDANLEIALALAEDIRASAATVAIEYEGEIIGPLTLTIGVACFPDDGETALKLLEEADLAVIIGKNHGKNRVLPARNPLRRDSPPY